MIPDQQQLWDKKHGNGEHEDFRNDASPFAQLVTGYLKPASDILELGCGVGRDAVFFAGMGHKVTATDFSKVIIDRDKREFGSSGIKFLELDMEKEFPYETQSFDAVYANLSLHYYLDVRTKAIVSEVARVLKSGGIFAFSCKSTNDAHYGAGEEVESNVFVSETGHVRHLFSQDYAKKLVTSNFDLLLLKEVEETYGDQVSTMVQCIARRSKDGE